MKHYINFITHQWVTAQIEKLGEREYWIGGVLFSALFSRWQNEGICSLQELQTYSL